ncbi:MAG: hypothetical protein ABFS56_04580 [Pseudomonadota bacterium]
MTNILDEDWRMREEGGPYADTLIAELADNGYGWKAISKIHEEETEDFERAFDGDQTKLRFWWD